MTTIQHLCDPTLHTLQKLFQDKASAFCLQHHLRCGRVILDTDNLGSNTLADCSCRTGVHTWNITIHEKLLRWCYLETIEHEVIPHELSHALAETTHCDYVYEKTNGQHHYPWQQLSLALGGSGFMTVSMPVPDVTTYGIRLPSGRMRMFMMSPEQYSPWQRIIFPDGYCLRLGDVPLYVSTPDGQVQLQAGPRRYVSSATDPKPPIDVATRQMQSRGTLMEDGRHPFAFLDVHRDGLLACVGISSSHSTQLTEQDCWAYVRMQRRFPFRPLSLQVSLREECLTATTAGLALPPLCNDDECSDEEVTLWSLLYRWYPLRQALFQTAPLPRDWSCQAAAFDFPNPFSQPVQNGGASVSFLTDADVERPYPTPIPRGNSFVQEYAQTILEFGPFGGAVPKLQHKILRTVQCLLQANRDALLQYPPQHALWRVHAYGDTMDGQCTAPTFDLLPRRTRASVLPSAEQVYQEIACLLRERARADVLDEVVYWVERRLHLPTLPDEDIRYILNLTRDMLQRQPPHVLA